MDGGGGGAGPSGGAAGQPGAAAGSAAGTGGDLGMLVVEYDYTRRISTASMLSEAGDAQQGHTGPEQVQQVVQQVTRSQQHWRLSYRKCESPHHLAHSG